MKQETLLNAVQAAVDKAHQLGIRVTLDYEEHGFMPGERTKVLVTAERRTAAGTTTTPSKYDCLRKLKPDEPYFLLRAKDRYAPKVIRNWASQVMNDPTASIQSREKAAEAYELAGRMEAWQSKNGCKVPD